MCNCDAVTLQNFYNFLKDESSEYAATTQRKRSFASFSRNGYSKYLSSKVTREGGLDGLMDTVIKNKLRIIPKNVRYPSECETLGSKFYHSVLAIV